jgi:hypothetical protein
MIKFYEYLQVINEGKTSGKTGLYPLGYGGVGQYPPEYLLPGSADAIYTERARKPRTLQVRG